MALATFNASNNKSLNFRPPTRSLAAPTAAGAGQLINQYYSLPKQQQPILLRHIRSLALSLPATDLLYHGLNSPVYSTQPAAGSGQLLDHQGNKSDHTYRYPNQHRPKCFNSLSRIAPANEKG